MSNEQIFKDLASRLDEEIRLRNMFTNEPRIMRYIPGYILRCRIKMLNNIDKNTPYHQYIINSLKKDLLEEDLPAEFFKIAGYSSIFYSIYRFISNS